MGYIEELEKLRDTALEGSTTHETVSQILRFGPNQELTEKILAEGWTRLKSLKGFIRLDSGYWVASLETLEGDLEWRVDCRSLKEALEEMAWAVDKLPTPVVFEGAYAKEEIDPVVFEEIRKGGR